MLRCLYQRVRDGRRGYTHVIGLGCYSLHHGARTGALKLYHDTGVMLQKSTDDAGNETIGVFGQSDYAHCAGGFFLDRLGDLTDTVQSDKRPFDLLVEGMGVLGRDQSPGAAFEQLKFNRQFQIANQAADRRLGNVEDLGGGGG